MRSNRLRSGASVSTTLGGTKTTDSSNFTESSSGSGDYSDSGFQYIGSGGGRNSYLSENWSEQGGGWCWWLAG